MFDPWPYEPPDGHRMVQIDHFISMKSIQHSEHSFTKKSLNCNGCRKNLTGHRSQANISCLYRLLVLAMCLRTQAMRSLGGEYRKSKHLKRRVQVLGCPLYQLYTESSPNLMCN